MSERHEIAIATACKRHVGVLLQEANELSRDQDVSGYEIHSSRVKRGLFDHTGSTSHNAHPVTHDGPYPRPRIVNIFRNRRRPGVITIAAVAVAIGLLPLPFGYYMLLRVFLCVLCIYFISSVRAVRDREKWVLVGLAVLYNPIAPVELGSKPLWSIVSIGTVAWFWWLERRSGR